MQKTNKRSWSPIPNSKKRSAALQNALEGLKLYMLWRLVLDFRMNAKDGKIMAVILSCIDRKIGGGE